MLHLFLEFTRLTKVGLLNLAEELGNISKACHIMGFSRDTFYRYKEAVKKGGINALIEKSRKKPNLKNRTDEVTEKTLLDLSLKYPAYGQLRISNELRKKGLILSPVGVRCVWIRHNLENVSKRLKALEKESAKKGFVLTEGQLQAFEKAKEEKEIRGEIETHHPGYLGSQDTFYVGNLKGVGRIYQQTFIDTYCKVAHAKLYKMKTHSFFAIRIKSPPIMRVNPAFAIVVFNNTTQDSLFCFNFQSKDFILSWTQNFEQLCKGLL